MSHQRKQDEYKCSRGFTLVELVAVILIMGILAYSLVIVSFDHRTGNLTAAAIKVQSDILHARSLALTKRGTAFGVTFSEGSGSYVVYETIVTNPVKSPLTRAAMIEDFSKFIGISITGGDYTVEFNRNGKPTTGGGGSVQITDGTTTKTIKVTDDTGRVFIQ